MVPGNPQQNTGGYRYVAQLVAALNRAGTPARVTGLPGQFPQPDAQAVAALNELLAGAAEHSWVVLDGLAMSAMPEVLEAHTARLNLVALIHHPLADETGLSAQQQSWFFDAEKRALAAVPHVVTTSRYTAERLAAFGVTRERIGIAEPGIETCRQNAMASPPEIRTGDTGSPQLLCVAHLSPRKAQHQLVEALAGLKDVPWHCVLAGSTERHPHYAEQVRQQIQQAGLEARITLTGEVAGAALAGFYHNADFFVLPSLYEGYGMVIDEALGAGLPVISSNGGALQHTADRPGAVLYNAGNVEGLQQLLSNWITDSAALASARLAASGESLKVRTWADTATAFTSALTRFQALHPYSEFSADWLSLRQPADYHARSRQLETQLTDWLSGQSVSRAADDAASAIVDLGTGLGSNAGYLATVLGGPRRWLLVDQDNALLSAATARLKPLSESVDTRVLRLSAQTFPGLLPVNTHLVTASALIDLVSAEWLKALVTEADSKRAAVLITLSYAGHFQLDPAHPDDDLLRTLVNQHQHGDKGLGAALGPDATATLAAQLRAAHYKVYIQASDWQLDANYSALARQLMQGWAQAAAQQDVQKSSQLQAWLKLREQQLSRSKLRITVCHHDLLALPRAAR